MSLLCFKAILKKCTNYAEESAHYAHFFLKKCPFLTITNTYSTGLAAILHFRAKSEGLGDLLALSCEVRRPRRFNNIDNIQYLILEDILSMIDETNQT